jgi:hypothetical protein
MQDIDFDEIDRAVSAASGSTPDPAATPRSAPQPSVRPERSMPRFERSPSEQHVATQQPSLRPVAQPIETVSEPEPETEPEPVAQPEQQTVAASPAARRSSGRFMDVVHPSSDMRPAHSVKPVISPSPSFVAEQKVPEPVVAPSNPFPSYEAPLQEEPEQQDIQDSASSSFHWPDPIDLDIAEPVEADSNTLTEEPVVDLSDGLSVPSAAPVAEIAPEPAAPHTPEEDQLDDDEIDAIMSAPLESPFLTDAKVEKRPLGAFSNAEATAPSEEPELSEPETTIDTDELDMSLDAPEPEASEAPEEPAPEMPRELHEDVLLLDAHTTETTVETEEPAPAVKSLTSVLETPNDAAKPVVAVTDVPVGPTSISQQYKEQPSSATHAGVSIYDTDTYHQPLTHPPKKRSSLLVIVWIIAIALVGGGLGLGLYLARPMLS